MSKFLPRDIDAMLRIEPDGLCRLDRRIYTDPEIFELELELIWGRSWVFLAHDSQLRKAGDFVTTHIGREPIVVTRNKKGAVQAFINACTHRGATLARTDKGNARLLSCQYHGWVFDLDGKLLAPKDEVEGGYPPSFDKSELGLVRVPRVESYRGFHFGNLDPGAMPLETYLGEARSFIDLLVDQGPDGVEVLKGRATYTFDANWKLQTENGIDGYHPTTVHKNFADTQRNRARSGAAAGDSAAKTVELIPTAATGNAGYFDFGHGHGVMWGTFPNPEERCNYAMHAEVAARIGKVRADWALGKLRNLLIYPSVFLMDNRGSQIRVIRPLSVDRTEITTYVIAPVGEPPEIKRKRLRQYEDFFNPSGMATPDDLAEFAAVQEGMGAGAGRWNDLSRGARNQVEGANGHARDLGISPRSSGEACSDEGVFIGQYRNWVNVMKQGLEARGHE